MKYDRKFNPFNSPLEIGIRALALLDAVYPIELDLQRLVDYDYLVIHSGDADGPESLHASLPWRTGEIAIRRGIIEKGLQLMMSRGLVKKTPNSKGIYYKASETTNPFLSALSSSYIVKLRERASWVVKQFGNKTDKEVQEITRGFFKKWTTQFQPAELPFGGDQ